MNWSLKLFSVRGIAVRIHFSFLLVMIWAAYLGLSGSLPGRGEWWVGLAFAEVFVLLLFVCVALHELSHALAAQLFGVHVQDITLWPLGGLARMTHMPETPLAEFVISAAGPAMNILLALLLGGGLLLWLLPQFGGSEIASLRELAMLISGWNLRSLLFLLVVNNVALAVFNLLPAFPMDGGRLLRSILAALMPFPTATRWAAWIGQGFAIAMFIVAVLRPGLILLALVAIFIFLAAGQERQQVRVQGNFQGLLVRQVMQRLGARLHPLQNLGQAAQDMLGSAQPVYLVVDAGRLVGILSRGDLLAALRRSGPEARVGQHMTRDIVKLDAGESLTVAHEKLTQNGVWVALVVDNGQVVGTLSQSDLNRLADMLQAYPGLLPRQ